MHEVAIVEQAIRTAISTADVSGGLTIDRLTFAIAPGGHVTPELVETLFSALSAGTPAEGAQLEFEELQAEYGCWSCAHTFHSHDQPLSCPSCRSQSISRLATGDLVLKYVDVREPVELELEDVRAGHSARTCPQRDELVRQRRRQAGSLRR